MPRVPDYSNPTVAPQSLPGARQQTPDGLNTGLQIQRQQDSAIGNGLLQAGGVVAQIVQQEQAEKNEADVKTAHAALTAQANDLLYNEQTGYVYKQGQNAVESKEATQQALDNARK